MVTYLEALYEVIRMDGSQRGRPDGQTQTDGHYLYFNSLTGPAGKGLKCRAQCKK